MPNIFEYADYRDFLRDVYRENKQRNPRYSYGYIAQKVGFSSPSFFSHIISGRTNISSAMIGRFVAFLRLNAKESDFFETLVLFNQASSHDEKKRYLAKMMAFRGPKVRIMDPDRYEFYGKWYHIAIRERLYFRPFNGNFEELARSLSPAIKPAQAKSAIALLLRLGMIRKDAQGLLRRADAISDSTGEEARSVAIDTFHLQALALAGEAIERFPRGQRSVSTLTLSLSPEGYLAIEEELAAFRKRLRKIAEGDSRENAVYHMNLSFFPFTKAASAEER